MPIYEYKCKKCGKQFEIFQKITDPALKSCRFCKGPAQKLISRTTFHLKGSGWYVTDFRNGGSSGAAGATAATSAAGAASAASDSPASSPSDGGAAAGGCGASCACH